MRKFVLALETGIDGGGVCILENEKLIESQSGSGSLSKSEDLLLMLDGLLEKNSIKKSEISEIVISDEPGSVTGLRIGLATARGMGDALGVPVRKVSILEALAIGAGLSGHLITAIINQKKIVYYREFLSEVGQKARLLSESVCKTNPDEFAERIRNSFLKPENPNFIFSEELSEELAVNGEVYTERELCRIHVVRGDLAEILGRYGLSEEIKED